MIAWFSAFTSAFEGSRHFLIDASSGKYNFLGPKQLQFKTMSALLEYYKYGDVVLILWVIDGLILQD